MARTVVASDSSITVKHMNAGNSKKSKIKSFLELRKARRKRYGR